MNTFLNKISQLDSIRDVILLSHQGEPLFYNRQKPWEDATGHFSHWDTIIKGLNKPQSADFLFDKGRYYLHHTPIGYLIIAIHGNTSFQKVKTACVNVQKKLSDPEICKRVLLKMLPAVDDMQKPLIIKELIPMADGEVARVLIPLLNKRSHFQPEARDSLLLHICRALGYCATTEAIGPLNGIVSDYDKPVTNNHETAIKEAAQVAMAQLDLDEPYKKKKIGQTVGQRITPKAVTPSPEKNKKKDTNHIDELLKNNTKDEVLSLVMQAIETAVLKKQFKKADKLRDELIRIDPMALTEIIRAAEIIEEEKSATISNDHLTTWQELALTLSSEEFTSLHHAMTIKSYATGEMIARQGEYLSTLFFVNRGRVQLYAVSQGREVALKTLSPGEIMGAGTFFEVSVWTVNAKSMGAELSLLHHKNLRSLKEAHPALQSKLREFCAKFPSSNTLFKDTKRTRRTSERKTLSGRTTITLIDKQGMTTGMGAKGDLLNISKGGVSFCLHFSQKEAANTFLGKAIRISIRSDISIPSLVRDGKVVAVRCQDFIGNEYSLHVKFDTPMTASEVQRAIQPTK